MALTEHRLKRFKRLVSTVKFSERRVSLSSIVLPPCPALITNEHGTPRFGTYVGSLDSVDLTRLSGTWQLGALKRKLRHKKWIYAFAANQKVATLFAVVDLNYTSNAFAMAVDLTDGRVLFDGGFLGPPRPLVRVNDVPGAGLEVRFNRPDAHFAASRSRGDGGYKLRGSMGLALPGAGGQRSFEFALDVGSAAPPLTVIAPVDSGGVVNITQKWSALRASGSISVDGITHFLDGGFGGLDSTYGYLARRTAWRWAFGSGQSESGEACGFNFVEGFNETRDDVNENALWLGTELIPMPRVRFTWNKRDVLEPWTVRSTDDRVQLTFQPLAVHKEHRDLGIVSSRFSQPVGHWAGRIQLPNRVLELKHVPGVAEDQRVVW